MKTPPKSAGVAAQEDFDEPSRIQRPRAATHYRRRGPLNRYAHSRTRTLGLGCFTGGWAAVHWHGRIAGGSAVSNHLVFCYECYKWKDFNCAGDPGQYSGDTLECPCGEETVVPKCMDTGNHDWGLFHVASLEPPSDVIRWLRLIPKPRNAQQDTQS